ncbi:MAG: GNAT family N-acetyltransferase [Chloroflexota bacterium]
MYTGNDLSDRVRIRNISVEDADALSRINSEITRFGGAEVDFREIIEAQVERSEGGVSFVAEVDGQVVGFMISYVIYGGFGLEKGAWIATLGVAPEFMGQGIGRKLAVELLNVYREKGIKYIYTSVPWDSVDLLSFFKTLGFDRSDFINLENKLE